MAAIHVSIVSHRQAGLVAGLLADLSAIAEESDLRISVLSNVPEDHPPPPAALKGRVEFIANARVAGFAANHNRVFRGCDAPYFCVLNPDIRFSGNPFAPLVDAFADDRVAAAAPAAYGADGVLQDNARRLPTPFSIASKVWSPPRGPDYPAHDAIVQPDWVAGLFMLLRSDAYRAVGGFDERYFLYYEDVDLCMRLRLEGWQIAWLPRVAVVHDARRESHRNPRYFLWHLRSVARFFSSRVYRRAKALLRTSA